MSLEIIKVNILTIFSNSDFDEEGEEFQNRVNEVIQQLENLGFDEGCIRNAIVDKKTLNIEILTEELNRDGNGRPYVLVNF